MNNARPYIDNATARHLLLHLQGLTQPFRRRLDATQLSQLILQLGYVQIDSINILARAHDMILHSRACGYQPSQLKQLLEQDRRLFEHWTHDASVIPIQFYPIWMQRFADKLQKLTERYRKWHGADFLEQLARVTQAITDHGPLRTRAFNAQTDKGPGLWWNWQPSKTALEYLWHTGTLAIDGRHNFEKIYDLSERVIPAQYRVPSPESLLDWSCREALQRLGFATPANIADFFGQLTTQQARNWCQRADAHRLINVDIEGADGHVRPHVARPDLLALIAQLDSVPSALRILSPFDPLLRNRTRMQEIFGFNYRIEIYVPAAKRQYGYYVFPVLEQSKLIARIEVRATASRDRLEVIGLWPEPGQRFGKQRSQRLHAELERQRRFSGCTEYVFLNGYWRGPAPDAPHRFH